MDWTRFRQWVFYALVTAIVAILGIFLGSMYSSYRTEQILSDTQEGLSEFLENNIKGIARGELFPDVTVGSITGDEAYRVHELLPDGGVLLYASGDCLTCGNALEDLDRAITMTASPGGRAVLIVQGRLEIVREVLAERDLEIPTYYDRQSTFVREYGVVTLPTAFVIDTSGIVEDFAGGDAVFDRLKEWTTKQTQPHGST